MNVSFIVPIAENVPVCRARNLTQNSRYSSIWVANPLLILMFIDSGFWSPHRTPVDGEILRPITDGSIPMDTNINKNKTSQLEGLLSPADVASLLQVSVATIHAWRHYGKPCPPAIQIGGLLRFRSEDLQQWINEQNVSKGAI